MTPLLHVITKYCAPYVDDLRLNELSCTNPALYARKMSQYMIPAISLFTLPAEMQTYLLGTQDHPQFVEPTYNSALYTVANEETSNFTIDLGEDFTGYELFCCSIRQTDETGDIANTRVDAAYDAQTGSVTVPATQEQPIAQGTVLEMDFYKDGMFAQNLSSQIQNILGMCFQIVWQERFSMDWLTMVSKAEDKSFYEQNRANKIRADTERLEMLRRQLAGEMRRFEENLYKNNFAPQHLQFPQTSGVLPSVYPTYEGSYHVIPKVTDQVLPTEQKVMADDLTVEEIPIYETSNESGKTIIIGGN